MQVLVVALQHPYNLYSLNIYLSNSDSLYVNAELCMYHIKLVMLFHIDLANVVTYK